MTYLHLELQHLEEIVPLFISAFNNSPWEDKWTIETARERLRMIVDSPGFNGLLAYEENTLVGMILGNDEIYYNGLHFVIKEFCTAANMQGKGIGSKLLHEFEQRLKQRGVKEITLMTLKGAATEGFYKGKGYNTLQDIIFMKKEV